MKTKANAKQKREAEAIKRKDLWSPKKALPAGPTPGKAPEKSPEKPAPKEPENLPQLSPEEETRLFLEYLEKHDRPLPKEDLPAPAKKKNRPGLVAGTLNLEAGMPVVSEAVSRMRIGLQEMRVSRVRVVKLIHGYGSTGRGGKICAGVREELASMKRKKLIRDYIPGEDFGPMDPSSRRLAETERDITRDPDYGRINHGITIVVL